MTLVPPLFIVLNVSSGQRDAETTEAIIRDVLDQGSRRYDLTRVDNPRQLLMIAKRTVERAQQHDGAIVAAGGDGTINAVAQAALHSGRPFGVLPLGKFNYFGRAHGIPEETAESTQVLLDARVRPVQVGLINDRVFLVNASVGLYPQMFEERERHEKQFGRSRFVAICAGLMTLLRKHRQLALGLEYDGQSQVLRTPTLVVGNNPLQLERIGIGDAHALQRGQLVALAVRAIGTLALLGLVCRGVLGQLGSAENVVTFAFDRLTVRPRSRRIKVAIDGEVTRLTTPLVFQVAPQPLLLLAPGP